MLIRVATEPDCQAIYDICMAAFSEDERETVATLAVDLLSDVTTSNIISLVAEIQGAVVAHVAFSPVIFDENKQLLGYILAPVAVKPGYQKIGVGSRLIKHGLQQLSRQGVQVLFVYGDPVYYHRFGFDTKTAHWYIAPYALQYPDGWQALVLKEHHLTSPVRFQCVSPLSDPELW